jgi:tetratricopeptide (TPR) repeat protein
MSPMRHAIQELVEQGKQCFENKEYAKAEQIFRKILAQQPNYADILNLLGVIHHIEGKFSSSMELFKKALKVNPHYTEAILNLAVLYNDLGKYKDAKKLYTHLRTSQTVKHKTIEPVLRGKLSNLHANIGDIYRNLGLYDHAIEEYKKALILNPRYADIRTNLGIALRENNQLSESLKELHEAVKSNPAYINARIQLGVTLYSSGKIGEAKTEWSAVLKKDAENEYAKMYMNLCKEV